MLLFSYSFIQVMHWCLVLICWDWPPFIMVSVLVVATNLVCPVPSWAATVDPNVEPKLVVVPKVFEAPVVPPPKLKEEFCCCCCCWFVPPKREFWVPPLVLKRPPDAPKPETAAAPFCD